jgi:nuclear cap-binding protein subunit 1
VEEPELVTSIVHKIQQELNECLKDPGQYRKARLLLRLVVCSVATGVIQPSNAYSVVKSFIDSAISIATVNGETHGRLWQPYTDHLVYMALSAIPFGGKELMEAIREEISELSALLDRYLLDRPRNLQPGLQPFAMPVKQGDRLAGSDAGAASFLSEYILAFKQMLELEQWELCSIPRLHMDYEVTLAGAQQTHSIELPTIPTNPPISMLSDDASDAVQEALVLQAFPPRGILRFLDDQHTLGDRITIERFIAEDYILDTIAFFEGNRVECAKQLAYRQPLPYAYEPLVCEVIFSQMLRLPVPEHKPVLYAGLIVDLCKLLKSFPRAIGPCMRESFVRMNVMDPALRERLAEWLAYHLSNFDYVWPWSKWSHVLSAPAYDGQRKFCIAVMNRMIRLAYWDRIHSALPEEFRSLLPPKPEVSPLPSPDAIVDESNLEGVWAAKLLLLVRKKASVAEVTTWITQNDLETVLGGQVGVLRAILRCLLVAGAKSYTHMNIALERYIEILSSLSNETGLPGQLACIEAIVETWAHSPQRALMAIQRTMTLRLLSAEAIVQWVFGESGARDVGNEIRFAMAWEILFFSVDKAIARVQDVKDELLSARRLCSESGDDNMIRQKEVNLLECAGELSSVILSILNQFVSALSEDGWAEQKGSLPAKRELDSDSAESTVLREYTLARLRSFMRTYHVQIAEVEPIVRREILAPLADEEVRHLVELHLSL